MLNREDEKEIMQKSNKRKDVLNGKSWTVIFVCMVIIGILGLSIYNYIVDPYQFFGKNFRGEWTNSQFYKARYVSSNLDEYDCFILGGSNSGVLDPALIESYTGFKTYNCAFALGNCYSYYDYIKFLLENADVKCIFLHLSSTEIGVSVDVVDSLDMYKMPAIINGNKFDILKQNISFLLKSVQTKYEKDEHKLYDNGQMDWSYYTEQFIENPEEYIERTVLADYQNKINTLGQIQLQQNLVDDNLEYMRKIKTMCDENDVQLIVVCGPVFISKRADFECNAYYDYLERLVEITDIWDFSGINSINANPYNFFDSTHYNYDLADEEIRFIFGDSDLSQEFGVLLTKDNILEYLQKRKNDFECLRNELLETGTIKYSGYDDGSTISILD